MSRKRGKYSKGEEQFIIDHVHDMSIQDMANELNRNTYSVEKFIQKKKLKEVVTQEDQEEIQRLLGILHESPHWEKVDRALTEKEIGLFEKDWINMVQQFGEDVWYTEEKYIVDWLLLDIKKYRIMKLEKDAMERIDEIELLIESTDNTSEKFELETKLAVQKASINSYATAYKDILSKIQSIADKLKANREERRDLKVNEDTFWGYVQMLDEDKKRRQQESNQAQLMKLAQDKAREKLYEYHEYMDGEVDIPLLTPEIVLRKAEEEKNEIKTVNNV